MGVTPDQLPAEIERLKNLLGQINAIAMFTGLDRNPDTLSKAMREIEKLSVV